MEGILLLLVLVAWLGLWKLMKRVERLEDRVRALLSR